MSQPDYPASPPAAAGQKKTSPWVWVLVGCLGLVVLVLLAMGACGWFVANKVKDVAGDFENNPTKAAAVVAATLHPDLEVVETDDEAGTITVRVESTGEVVTLDFDDMAEGKIGVLTGEGETTIEFGDADEGGGMTIDTPEGQVRFGAAAGGDVLPAWLPAYPGGSAPESLYSSTTNGQRSGAAEMTTTDSIAQILDFYEARLRDAGLTTSKSTFTAQDEAGGMVTGNSTDPKRTATVMVSDEDGKRSINATYNEGG